MSVSIREQIDEKMRELKEKHPVVYAIAKFTTEVLLCTLGVVAGILISRYLLWPLP